MHKHQVDCTDPESCRRMYTPQTYSEPNNTCTVKGLLWTLNIDAATANLVEEKLEAWGFLHGFGWCRKWLTPCWCLWDGHYDHKKKVYTYEGQHTFYMDLMQRDESYYRKLMEECGIAPTGLYDPPSWKAGFE